jgi:hypothetical protein
MRFVSWLIAAIAAPFLVLSMELLLTRHFNTRAADWDYVGMGVSLIAGLCCLWKLPTNVVNRVILTIIYVPFGIALVFYYSLVFVCIVFGDCL